MILHVLLWPAMVTVMMMILWRKSQRCWRSVVFGIGAIAPVIPHIFASNLGAGRPNMADKAVFKVLLMLYAKKKKKKK